MVVTSEAQMIIAINFAVCSRQNWINFIKLQRNFKCTEDLMSQTLYTPKMYRRFMQTKQNI